MNNAIKIIKEMKRDWESAGSYAKANACDYIVHRLEQEPTPDSTGKVLLAREQWEKALGFIGDLVDECAYGDDCPIGKHDPCLNCAAKAFLASASAGSEGTA